MRPRKNIIGRTCIPFLDHVVSQMTERFSGHFEVVRQLSSLVPGFSGFTAVRPCHVTDISEAVSFYSSLIDPDRVEHELQTWNSKWFGDVLTSSADAAADHERAQASRLPATALHALE